MRPGAARARAGPQREECSRDDQAVSPRGERARRWQGGATPQIRSQWQTTGPGEEGRDGIRGPGDGHGAEQGAARLRLSSERDPRP